MRESRTESQKEAYPPVSMCPGLMRNEAVLLLATPLTRTSPGIPLWCLEGSVGEEILSRRVGDNHLALVTLGTDDDMWISGREGPRMEQEAG